MQEMWVRPLGQEDSLEKEMKTHSSILASEIPWTEEPGSLVHNIAKSQTQLKQFSIARGNKGKLLAFQSRLFDRE